MRTENPARRVSSSLLGATLAVAVASSVVAGQDWWKPYSPPCTERDLPAPSGSVGGQAGNVFEFTEKPTVRSFGEDRHEITFAVKGFCDATVGIIDEEGRVVRHVGSGVLGSNAPEPFQKNSLKQTLIWNGKDDLGGYPQEAEHLRVRVMLGLKPEFDKCLGGTSRKNLAGWVMGLAADENGVYVWTIGHTAWKPRDPCRVRKFDHDGNYVKTLVPPPAGLPDEKRGGFGYVEYEPGKRDIQGPMLYRSLGRYGFFLPDSLLSVSGGVHDVLARGVRERRIQPALADGRMYYMSLGLLEPGAGGFDEVRNMAPTLHWLRTSDGSSDYGGVTGRNLAAPRADGPADEGSSRRSAGGKPSNWFPSRRYCMTSSPDGKWLFITGLGSSTEAFLSSQGPEFHYSAVLRCPADGSGSAEAFVGDMSGSAGAGEGKLNYPRGLDCDRDGRLYVADCNNNRVQVFSPEGKFLKAMPVRLPKWVGVHKKTGDVYVLHGSKKGVGKQDAEQVTKFSPFPELRELYRFDLAGSMYSEVSAAALDSWSDKPRLWLGRARGERTSNEWGTNPFPGRLIIWEETGKGLRKFLDFDEAARKEDGVSYCAPWHGGIHQNNLVCDPTREQFYWRLTHIFDLKSGKQVGHFLPPDRDPSSNSCFEYRGLFLWDAKFSKRGYMHAYYKAGVLPGLGARAECFRAGIVRLDPARKSVEKGDTLFAECPFDYGLEIEEGAPGYGKWSGTLDVASDCYRAWTMGLGVNMQGDMAIGSLIWYVPKVTADDLFALERGAKDPAVKIAAGGGAYGHYKWLWEQFASKQTRNRHVIARGAGIPLRGPVVWTFDRNGQLHEEDAVIVGGSTLDGVDMDEDGMLYLACGSARLDANGKTFLAGRGGNYGGASAYRTNVDPITGTYMKTRGSKVRFLTDEPALAPVPMQKHEIPERPPDFVPYLSIEAETYAGQRGRSWVDGAEWIYRGHSPICEQSCTCPKTRPWLDWYKRSFVLEMYRHSFGALDTNGNLIMHIGRYGNLDGMPDSSGPTVCFTDQIAGTDNYLVYCDYGERLTVLKIKYHTEETVPIPAE